MSKFITDTKEEIRLLNAFPHPAATVIKYIRCYLVAGFVLLSKTGEIWLKPWCSFFLSHYVLKASSLGYQIVSKRGRKEMQRETAPHIITDLLF